MSADNYYLIRRAPGGFLVTCESASDDRPESTEVLLQDLPRLRGRLFSSLQAAQEYAYEQYAEYGVSYDFPVKTVEA